MLQLGFEHEKDNVENLPDTNQHNAGNVLQGNQQLNVGDFINIGNHDALPHVDGFLANPMYIGNDDDLHADVFLKNPMNIGNDDALPHADGFLENPMYMVNVSIEFYTCCN